MFIILPEDLPCFIKAVSQVVEQLSAGAKRVDTEVDIGDQLPVATVTGYWVVDVMRIDIKLRK